MMTKGRLMETGFLGPVGTFTEEVARQYAGNMPETLLKEYMTIDRIIEDVAEGVIAQGVVPLENSLEGSVNITLDMLFATERVFVYREIIYPISHALMSAGEVTLEEIREVYSHYQAFAQCRGFLRKNLPGAALIPMESTASAAKWVAERAGGPAAAIAPLRTAEIFGLKVQAQDIQDHSENTTRFVVLRQSDHSPTGRDKTSLVLSIKDKPGSLYEVLGIFTRRSVNLTRIESRPSRRNLGEYYFFIDFQGHRAEPSVKQLLAELKEAVVFYKILGSYPQDKQKFVLI